MKQVFSEKSHEKIKGYLNMKDTPGKWDILYMEKTRYYIKYIKWIPGIQMIGVGNSISMNHGTKNSDIDLLIVSSQNRLWLVRICSTIIFQLLGVRKTRHKHSGRMCLSFFTTIDGLDFGNFALTNDIYLYFWIVYFKPILNYNNTYEKLLSHNTWADFIPYEKIINHNKKSIQYQEINGTSEGKFFTFVNKMFNICLLPKTLRHYSKIGKPYGIIITPNILKFHNNDIRKKIRDELQ